MHQVRVQVCQGIAQLREWGLEGVEWGLREGAGGVARGEVVCRVAEGGAGGSAEGRGGAGGGAGAGSWGGHGWMRVEVGGGWSGIWRLCFFLGMKSR